MTPEEKSRLSAMRKAGSSYTEIADALGISKNTVKTFCRRNGLTPEAKSAPEEATPVPTTERLCPHCGKPVIQPQGRKEKKFCSDTCRNRWRNSHMDLVNVTHKQVRNTGELPMYFIEGTHPAIIAMETFQAAQQEFAQRYGVEISTVQRSIIYCIPPFQRMTRGSR